MRELEIMLDELETKIPEHETTNVTVSNGSVGWHIEHILLTINVITYAIKQSNPEEYRWAFNLKRTLILTLGKIPRGRVKAPKLVQPNTSFNSTTLQQHLAKTKTYLKGINQLQRNHFFKHPFFGDLNLKPSIRFLQIHTQHHLHIINDIISSKN